MSDARRLPMPRRPASRHIGDEEILTHVGRRRRSGAVKFHNKPRPQDAGQLSMIAGRLEVADAIMSMNGQESTPEDVVRYVSAGQLRAAGFRVSHTPTERQAEHVSITVPGGAIAWDDEQESALAEAIEKWRERGL